MFFIRGGKIMLKTYSMDLAGRNLTIETGKMAELANRKCTCKIW